MNLNEARNCKICRRVLYTPFEKKEGICVSCERSSAGTKCMKCGVKLLLTPEIQSKLCQKCRGRELSCNRCGAKLFREDEKRKGLCLNCARKV